MIESLVLFIETNLLPLGSTGIFIASVIEEVVAPIPSAIVMLGSGFFFLEGVFSIDFFKTLFIYISLPIALGATLGSIFIYALFALGSKPAIDKWGKWLGFSWNDVEKVKNKFENSFSDELIIFMLRVVPIIPNVAIAAFCGIIKYKFIKYIFVTFFGIFTRASILAFVGFKVGDFYREYASVIKEYETYAFVFIIILSVLTFVFKLQKRSI